MVRPAARFYLIGLMVAGLEEFITQGVLKHNFGGWIIPTLIAFGPFLIIVRLAGGLFHRRWPAPQAALYYYLLAGSIGLAVEWFLIGLSPWSNPNAHPLLMLAFQVGMFSFWTGVACTPILLLDQREIVAPLRRRFRVFLPLGMAMIYAVTFLAPKGLRFPAAIGTVLITFIGANAFYLQYLRALRAGTYVSG